MILLLTDVQGLGVALIGFAVAVIIVGVLIGLVGKALMKR